PNARRPWRLDGHAWREKREEGRRRRSAGLATRSAVTCSRQQGRNIVSDAAISRALRPGPAGHVKRRPSPVWGGSDEHLEIAECLITPDNACRHDLRQGTATLQ